MPNLPLAFADMLAGGILVTAGIYGVSPGDAVAGHLPSSLNPLTGGGGSSPNTPTPPTTGGTVVPTIGTAAVRVKAMQAMAAALNGKPYAWGGGHSSWAIQAGYDCSGFVSAVLHAGGYLGSPQTTGGLATSLVNGPGQYVTVYDRTDSGSPSTDHTIIDIAGQWWESGGGGAQGKPSVHQINKPDASYLASFNRQLHPQGL